MDNLESQTYEVFEKDPIKYSQYQQVRQPDIFWGMRRHGTDVTERSLLVQ